METFIYDPAKSKQYNTILFFNLLMKPRVPGVGDAMESFFERVKGMSTFKRVGEWSLERIQLSLYCQNPGSALQH